jgi:hypothetical protein
MMIATLRRLFDGRLLADARWTAQGKSVWVSWPDARTWSTRT